MTLIFDEITPDGTTRPGLKLEVTGTPEALEKVVELLGLAHYSITARSKSDPEELASSLRSKRPDNMRQMHTHQWKGQGLT